MPDIRLYVACHKEIQLPEHPFLYPVQVGAAMTTQCFQGMLRDDTGEHISAKNHSYCELTAQYWAWKNQKADYYGFFHYRRFLTLQQQQKRICTIYPDVTMELLQRNGYEPAHLQQFVSRYDLLLPCGETTAETVYEKYAGAAHHVGEDLEWMAALVTQYQPEYQAALQQYLTGQRQYYFNMYIMRHELFQQYCRWLFPLLERFDRSNNWDKYGEDPLALRVDGYLAERLFGVWYTYQTTQNQIRSIELPWMYFAMDSKKAYYKQRLKESLLPAGSRRKRTARCISQKLGALKNKNEIIEII